MPCVFNPGYIGPNPPCCDPDCTDENNCNNPECGPCPGPNAPCGGCAPPIDAGKACAVTVAPVELSQEAPKEEPKDCEACSNKASVIAPSTPTNQSAQ
ncbi:male-specific sperm protein Mst84Dd-like [Drosophila innubila]|uniref:male-specific sperm protein Mst84Dd-like n=1 Tax=Drosophila innubila TaxID=198719 RepID=UPI00148DB107|nr:male-specific sperm protein Mst84Dd-like [Drosophila innubila]